MLLSFQPPTTHGHTAGPSALNAHHNDNAEWFKSAFFLYIKKDLFKSTKQSLLDI